MLQGCLELCVRQVPKDLSLDSRQQSGHQQPPNQNTHMQLLSKTLERPTHLELAAHAHCSIIRLPQLERLEHQKGTAMAQAHKGDKTPREPEPAQEDFSVFDVRDLRKLRRIINDELKSRRDRSNQVPPIGTKVEILHGARKGQVGVISLHMANRTCLIQFPGGGMSRIMLSRIHVQEKAG